MNRCFFTIIAIFIYLSTYAQTSYLGKVVYDNGKAASGVRITINESIQVMSSSSGEFGFSLDNTIPKEVDATKIGYSLKKWDMPNDQSVLITLQESNDIYGKVYNSSRMTWKNVEVVCVDNGETRTATSNKKGEFIIKYGSTSKPSKNITFTVNGKTAKRDEIKFSSDLKKVIIRYKQISGVKHLVLVDSAGTPFADESVKIDERRIKVDQYGEIFFEEAVPLKSKFVFKRNVIDKKYNKLAEELKFVLSRNLNSETANDKAFVEIEEEFSYLDKVIEEEQQYIKDRGKMFAREMSKIKERLDDEDLTTEEKAALVAYIDNIKNALSQNEKFFNEAQQETDELMLDVSDRILEQESLVKKKNKELEEVREENALQQKDFEFKSYLLGGVAFFLGLVAIVYFVMIGRVNQQKKRIQGFNSKLKEAQARLKSQLIEINQQKEEIQSISENLEMQNSQLASQREEIKEQADQIGYLYNEVKESIMTGKVVQDSILPSMDDINQAVADSFVLYRPKDIVSGDFYWAYIQDDSTYIAAADCTGHGVAGAFMSIVGHNILNNIMSQHRNLTPADILDKLNTGVIKHLHQGQEGSKSRDGMDITMVRIQKGSNIVQFAGAYNPLYLVRASELQDLKVNKFSIGIPRRGDVKPFTPFEIEVKSGDKLYMFSDGYADQLGGEDGMTKFKYPTFREMIIENSTFRMESQHDTINDRFESWLNGAEQLDDVLVMGLKIA